MLKQPELVSTASTCGGGANQVPRPRRSLAPEGDDRCHHDFDRQVVDAEINRHAIRPEPYFGGMFWLIRKKLSGSYLRFRAFSRSYLCAPYACRIRSSPSFIRKLT